MTDHSVSPKGDFYVIEMVKLKKIHNTSCLSNRKQMNKDFTRLIRLTEVSPPSSLR